jgi:outer membrane lipoprotein-sorting protein
MNCTECKEILVEYIEGLLEESQKQAVSEHLKKCSTCKTEFNELANLQKHLVANGKKVKESNLEDKVMDNIILEQNMKLKAIDKAGSAIKLRNTIMKNPVIKIAAVAIIIIAVLVGINPFKPSITIAQVVEPILNARTIIFDLMSGTDETGMVVHEIVVGSRIRRTMSNMPNMTMIIDMDNEQLLALDTNAKTAFYADIEGELGDMTRSYIGFVRQIIRQFQDDQVEKLGEQIIDGHKAIGFKGRGHNEEVTIWADSQTAIPIQIEVHSGQGLAFLMKNFVFDAQVEESLVSMDVPNGYTQKKTEVNLGNATEQDFIESLRIWAEVIRDGSFPEAIGTQNTMEQMPVLIEKIGQMNISEEEATQMGVTFGKGMLFLQIIDTRGDEWKYVGAGVKLGETNKAIFWYQPEGPATYHVIYGDLHVEEVAPENLPK